MPQPAPLLEKSYGIACGKKIAGMFSRVPRFRVALPAYKEISGVCTLSTEGYVLRVQISEKTRKCSFFIIRYFQYRAMCTGSTYRPKDFFRPFPHENVRLEDAGEMPGQGAAQIPTARLSVP
jgi:hypothetical protein